MYRVFFIFIFFVQNFFGQQNLVPNWSFESITSCPPSGYSGLSSVVSWFQPNYTYLSSGGSTDLFNACLPNGSYNVPNNGINFQQAKSGGSYVAISVFNGVNADSNEYREYCEIRLVDTLKQNKKYCVKYFVSNVNILECSYVVGKIEGYFSSDSLLTFIPNNGVISNVLPQLHCNVGMITDTVGWTKIQNLYNADGTELFLTVGNFSPFSEIEKDTMCPGGGGVFPAYYFLDDVSVYEIPEVYAGKDTTFCPWQSVVLGPSSVRSDVLYRWSPAYGLNDSTLANPIAIPLQTTTYTLTVIDTNQWACYSQMYDTVTITVSGCVGISENSPALFGVRVFPNPFADEVNFELEREDNYELRIFDVFGNIIYEEKFTNKHFIYKREHLESGFYFYSLTSQRGGTCRGQLVIE